MSKAKERMFYDVLQPDAQNNVLMEYVIDYITGQFPVVGKNHTLELREISADQTTKDPVDFPGQKDIKLKGGTWALPIYGHLVLRDNITGKVIDESKKIKMLNLPLVTNRYSMIIDGSEYQTINQLRLKSGIYTRIKENGELESWFDLEKGFNFKMIFDPETKLFYLILANRKFKLYPILKALAFPDEEMRKAWGREIYEENQRLGLNRDIKEIPDLVEKLTKQRPASYDVAVEMLNTYLNSTKVNPQTTKLTLGESYDKVDAETLFATSKKVLGVLRGEKAPDERDSLIFKNIYNPTSLLAAFMDKQSKTITANLRTRTDSKTNVRDIISSDTYSKPFKKFYTVGDLSSTPEQTNPVSILNEWRKTTVMGTGGVQSPHAITLGVRDVHPTQMGFLDAISTPESGKVGVTLPLAVDVVSSKEKEIKKEYILPDGSRKIYTPLEASNLVVGFPDQWAWVNGKPKPKGQTVKVMARGAVREAKASEVNAWIDNPWSLFSWPTNLIPFMHHDDAVRASFGSKMTTQAIPLDNKESPFVESRIVGNENPKITFEQAIGKFLNPIVPDDIKSGVVTKVTDDYVYIKPDGSKTVEKLGLFNNFPLNRETFLHSTPIVKEGDRVKAEDAIARNNFQDETGSLSIGLNVNVAYMPWKGLNYEDSAVITESLAKRFTSSKIIAESIITNKDGILNLKKFRAYFPTAMTDTQANQFDPDGVIKVDSEVDPDGILVAYMESKDMTDSERILRSMNKSMYIPYSNRSLTWHGHDRAKVIYVNKLSGGQIVIHLKVSSPMVVGDKIAGRHGNKSIVSRIIPDDEAPHTQEGKRIDLILSPNGVPGRMNAGQLLETAAGKISQATGEKFYVNNFGNDNYLKKIQDELKKAGLSADDVLLDGKGGKPFIKPIFNGNQYIMKLMHVVEHKAKARSYGSYSIEEQPSRGDEPGQKVDPLTTFALLSHGARENLREFASLKSQRNDETWAAIQSGRPIPPPQVNFAFEKLLGQLKGVGVNVNKNGSNLTLEPMTDEEVLAMSNGRLKDPGHILIGKNLDAIPGGLYDKTITGGLKGKKWSHIELVERMPHPLYEKPLLSIFGLTKPQFLDTIAGKHILPNGKTGAAGLEDALRKLDIDKEIAISKERLTKASRTEINSINRRIRYLQALQKFGKNPADVYMIKNFPIMPPAYRPILVLPSGDLNNPPINMNYRNLGLANDALAKDKETPGLEELYGSKTRLELYNELSHTVGITQDTRPNMESKTEGILMSIAGKGSPKFGYAHNKLWGKRQDLSARSTITLDPQLGLDEIGLPEVLYKKIFLPFAVNELVNRGYSPLKAREEIKNDTDLAKNAYVEVMKRRPVIMNRAPSLHKHSVQAHLARPTAGSSIKLNPLIVKGYGADFDGDTMSVHVPVGSAAVEEAYTMLPSKNIWQPGSKSNIPAGAFAKDYMLGLWQLTRERNATSYSVKNLAEANALHKDGKLELNDTLIIGGKRTSLGRQMVMRTLPEDIRNDYDKEITKKELGQILNSVAKNHSQDFSTIIDALKDLALQFGHAFGSTISINDLDIDRSYRDKILSHYKAVEQDRWTDNQKARHWLNAQQQIEAAQNAYVKKTGKARGFYDMLESGAESKQDSVRQLISMPGVKIDVYGKPMPMPITKSYAEGLDQASYWMSLYGARKGMVDRAINTEQSGAINKSLLGVTKSLLVVEADCGTEDGVEIEVSDTKNLLDRFLAKTIPGVGKAGTEVNNMMITAAKSKKMQTLLVRSPLTCETANGVCQKCYGIAEDGNLVAIGTNIGIKEGQSMTERSTQLVMKSFHSGGSAAAEQDVVAGFPKMEQVLKVPEIVANKATLASVRGTVNKIEKSTIGGLDVYVGGVKHHVPFGRALLVKRGDFLEEGDAISSGSIKPQELQTYKGYQAARLQMVNDLQGVFSKEGLGRKTYETVIRGIANQAVIDDAPEDTEYIRGDTTVLSKVMKENKERKLEGKPEIKYTPYFKSIDTLAMDNPDWLSKLTVNRIRETLKDGAALGSASNLHGTDPMPAYLHGAEFNKNVDFSQGRFY